MPVTLEQVANAAGVSIPTASRALHGTYPVAKSTKLRVLQAAENLCYRPNIVARSLRTEQTYTIGIVVDDIGSPFSPLIIRGIQDYLQEHAYFSIIVNADRNPDIETKALHDLISRSIDGIILVESYLRGANPALDLANKPYVFVHRLFSGGAPNSITADESFGAHLAMEHLTSLGHRRIGHISGPEGWDATVDRLAAYREVLAQQALDYDPELVREGDWGMESGLAATRALLSLPQRPTAIFAANDPMAFGALHAVQEAALRVPDDIAVIGYDDQQIARLSRPSITTVTLPCYDMGLASAQLLIGLLDGQGLPAQPIRLRGNLIVRQSSGAP
jgi:LacI family transcriptional regulator